MEFDLEEGCSNSGAVVRGGDRVYIIIPLVVNERKGSPTFRDTVVTLCSWTIGSRARAPNYGGGHLRDILARTLERGGVKVDNLGFTTRAWKAVQRAMAWLAAASRPIRAGSTICAIYLQIRRRGRGAGARKNLGLMMARAAALFPFFKENIDGRGADWAHKRLLGRARAAQRS